MTRAGKHIQIRQTSRFSGVCAWCANVTPADASTLNHMGMIYLVKAEEALW